MLTQINRTFGTFAPFAPDPGKMVIAAPGSGPGWWSGAPGICYTDGVFHMVYRIRSPQPVRGGEMRIAVSIDGVHFTTIWSASKADFDSPSIERSALVHTDDGCWRLYVSYVNGADGRWCIDMLEAEEPAAFDPSKRIPILRAADIAAEGVKDPWIFQISGVWHMVVSYAPRPEQLPADPAALHATHDIYNTGYTKSLSGLATSQDGVHWHWRGPILVPPEQGWDQYATRLNSLIWAPPVWIGFYDGSASVAENYEERCGLAYSFDLHTWLRSGLDGPTIGAAGGPGSVRYVEAVQTTEWTRYFYEYTLPDGAHELRTSLITASSAT